VPHTSCRPLVFLEVAINSKKESRPFASGQRPAVLIVGALPTAAEAERKEANEGSDNSNNSRECANVRLPSLRSDVRIGFELAGNCLTFALDNI